MVSKTSHPYEESVAPAKPFRPPRLSLISPKILCTVRFDKHESSMRIVLFSSRQQLLHAARLHGAPAAAAAAPHDGGRGVAVGGETVGDGADGVGDERGRVRQATAEERPHALLAKEPQARAVINGAAQPFQAVTTTTAAAATTRTGIFHRQPHVSSLSLHKHYFYIRSKRL